MARGLHGGRIDRGSWGKRCSIVLVVVLVLDFPTNDRTRPGKEMLARIVAMLTRPIDRFDRDEPPIREG